MHKFMKIIIFSCLFLGLGTFSTQAKIKKSKAPTFNIKNDFCGKSMPAQFCKCAFHGTYCDRAQMDQTAANNYVQKGFQGFVNGKVQAFKAGCEYNSAYFKGNTCYECIAPHFKETIKGKIGCYELDELCDTSDKLIIWNAEKDECTCQQGYQINEETGYCEEATFLDYEINFPEKSPPFISDGESTYKIHISVKNAIESIPMNAESISIEYTTGPKKGKILKIENPEVGEYDLIYQPPKIENAKKKYEDGIYIFYVNPITKEKLYKTYAVAYTTGVPVIIKKEGFKPLETSLSFTSEETEVRVFVKDASDKKIPINEVEVAFSDFKYEETNEDGIAMLPSPFENEGGENTIQEFILEIDPKFADAKIKTEREYRQLISGEMGITNKTIKNFIENFETEIAQAPEEKIDDLFIGMRRTGYALLHLTEGRGIAVDLAQESAGSIKNMFVNLIDWLDVSEKVSKKIGEKLKLEKFDKIKEKINDKVNGKITEKLGTNKASEFLKEEFGNQVNEMLDGLLGKFKDSFVQAILKHAPDLPKNTGTKVWESVFGKPGDGTELKDRLTKITEYAGNNIQKEIETILIDQYDITMKANVKRIESMIKSKNFHIVGFTADIFETKWKASDLREQYLTAHEVSYNITMIKASVDLLNNTAGEAAKMTVAWKKYAEAIEAGYKAVRSTLLDTTDLYYWFSTYSEYINASNKNIQEVLGLDTSNLSVKQNKKLKKWSFFPIANAEVNPQNLQEKNMKLAEEIEVLKDLQNINKLFQNVYTDDPEIKALSENLNQKIETNTAQIPSDFKPTPKPVFENNEDKNNDYQIDPKNDINGDGEVTLADFTMAEWGLLGFLLIILFLFLKGLKKIFSKKR